MTERPVLDAKVWQQAVDTIAEADDVALACHVGPDGDALGSMLALAIGLRELGKRPIASWGSEPFAVPPMYTFLPGLDLLVEPEFFPTDPPLLVTFDTGSVDRLGGLREHFERAGRVIVIDHHASSTYFGDINLVDPQAAATAVLVDELLQRLGVPLSADIAACLYTGVSTDTGSFRFAATTPAVHDLGARLLATGIKHDEISRAIWDSNRFPYLKLLGLLLARAELVENEGLVWTWVSREDLLDHDVQIDEIEGVIDVIRTSIEAQIAVICKQGPDGQWLVSMRSKGAVDVSAVAVAFGGGGHRFAAGFTSPDGPVPTMQRLRAALRDALRTAWFPE